MDSKESLMNKEIQKLNTILNVVFFFKDINKETKEKKEVNFKAKVMIN